MRSLDLKSTRLRRETFNLPTPRPYRPRDPSPYDRPPPQPHAHETPGWVLVATAAGLLAFFALCL